MPGTDQSTDKYELYTEAVQQPEQDAEFFEQVYTELTERRPRVLREDFCGTFRVACEWVKRGGDRRAFGLDLDEEPMAYGRRYLEELTPDQRERVEIKKMNVLDPGAPRADIIAAQNFSYCIFKKRPELLRYARNCFSTLNENGIFLIDIFGGSMCQEANEEKTRHDGFTYYWEQESFDPIHNHAVFSIHFRPDGNRKIEKVFTYDWRLWTIPELREIMDEAGFRRTFVYWEGTEGEEGNGVFTRTEAGEECQSWIAYVVGVK